MLKIVIPGSEYFNAETNEIFTTNDLTLELEHSLRSISLWEGIHNKPFLSKDRKTSEEALSYIQCMNRTDVPLEAYQRLSESDVQKIVAYINGSETATWFNDKDGGSNRPPSRRVITSEIFYSWMVSMRIPFECQDWHLSRLYALIRICSEQNAPKKKMGRAELAQRNRELNEARKAQLNTKG